ncbi:MAG: ribonuclease HII [Chloroflexota bacterium]
MRNNLAVPTFDEEQRLGAQGYTLVAGVDEVGRGALAGPVAAAAVILPAGLEQEWLGQVRDSKLLKPAVRRVLAGLIAKSALAVGVGMVSHEEIDAIGIAPASRLAMKIAVAQLSPVPQYLLVDYFRLPEIALPQKGIVGGDGICFSIACASIVAKVARDRLMKKLDRVYRGYGFARHKGYATGAHLDCISRLGPSPIHRRSFQPLREAGCPEA